MTLDDAIAALIAAATDPLKADITALALASGLDDDRLTELEKRVLALEKVPAPAPAPVPTPPPPAVDAPPKVPAGYGSRFLKNFADNKLAPFYKTAYPDDPSHVAPGQKPGEMQSGQYMTQWCRYTKALTDPALISVHDGYLDLGCRRRPDGSGFFDGSFVTTGMPKPTAAFSYPFVRWMARFPTPTGKADWRCLWLLDGDSWGAAEPDWPEVINGKMTANVHGPAVPSGVTPFAIPAGWHEWGTDMRQVGVIKFTLDGVEKGRATASMPTVMALLADSKVGLAAPDASTPDMLRLHIAWATVD